MVPVQIQDRRRRIHAGKPGLAFMESESQPSLMGVHPAGPAPAGIPVCPALGFPGEAHPRRKTFGQDREESLGPCDQAVTRWGASGPETHSTVSGIV